MDHSDLTVPKFIQIAFALKGLSQSKIWKYQILNTVYFKRFCYFLSYYTI